VPATTFLFVPGDRPDRFGKAVASGADVVILDLEDAVAPGDKDSARAHVETWLQDNEAVVRINAPGTPWFDADAALVTSRGVPVVVPKAETPGALAGFREVIALIETARGVERAGELAAVPSVTRLAFGSVDLAAELGVAPEDREPFAYASPRTCATTKRSRPTSATRAAWASAASCASTRVRSRRSARASRRRPPSGSGPEAF
jgi:citrate lyase subunit beta/citryl-CoA lyase